MAEAVVPEPHESRPRRRKRRCHVSNDRSGSRRALHGRLCGDRRDGPRGVADAGLHVPGGSSSTTAAGGLTTEEGGFQRAREIATEIARQYRGANGEQLVAVTAQTGEVSGLPLQYIALRHGRNRQLTQGDVSVVQPGETALFSFCGLAGDQNCSLPGQPTPQRLMLLRREAVELSYYTFKLLPEIQTVVSLLPPVPRGEGQPPQTFAVHFQRRHMEGLLGATSPGPSGEAAVRRRRPEPRRGRHDQPPHGDRLFTSSFEQLPTQGVMLSLSPPSA